MSNHNLDQCLADLDAETREMESKVISGIKKKSMSVLRQMIFVLAPVKTGFYRSSFQLGVNKIIKSRITSLANFKRHKKLGIKTIDQIAQLHMEDAAKRFDEIRRIEDLYFINISNDAPHVHFIEGGGSKKAPAGVFSVGRQIANMELEKLNGELR